MVGTISNVQLKASKRSNNSNLWDIEVDYDANFEPPEANNRLRYREGFELWEQDDTSGDDMLTGVVGVQVFEATNTKMRRTMKTTIDGAVLDTELGAEEIYAKLRLRHLDVGGQPLATGESPVVPIAP